MSDMANRYALAASHCVLACYNGLIPHLCPGMSEQQKAGLKHGVKLPFVYAYPYLGLDDPEWSEGQAPHEIG